MLGLTPMSSDDLNIWTPVLKVLAAAPKEFAGVTDEPSVETLDVSMDAVEAVPEAKLVPDVSAALDDIGVTSAVSGDVDDEDEVTADASAWTALGIAVTVSGDTVCTPVPADVPSAWVAAAANPASPDEFVVSSGAVNGVSVDAVDDAPA